MNADTKGGIPRNVGLLIYAFSPNYLAFGFIMVVVSAWLVQIGTSPAIVGLILGVEGGTAIVTTVPFGIISDVRSRKAILVGGAFAASLAFLIFAFTTYPLYLVAAGAIGGVSEGATTTTWNALLADQTSIANRDKSFSLSFVIQNVATGLGFATPAVFPLLGAAIGVESLALHHDFLLSYGLLSLATPVATLLILRNYKETHNPSRRWQGLKNKRALTKLALFGSSIGLGAGFIIPLIATWFFLRFGVGDSYSGPVLAISNILIGFSALVSPRLARRMGTMRAIVFTQGVSTFFMLSLAFIPLVNLAAAVYMVRTALMNMGSPLMDSFVMGIFAPEQRGLVSGLSNVMFRLPNSVSVFLGGIMLSGGLFQLPFFIASALYAAGIAMLYYFFGNARPAQ